MSFKRPIFYLFSFLSLMLSHFCFASFEVEEKLISKQKELETLIANEPTIDDIKDLFKLDKLINNEKIYSHYYNNSKVIFQPIHSFGEQIRARYEDDSNENLVKEYSQLDVNNSYDELFDNHRSYLEMIQFLNSSLSIYSSEGIKSSSVYGVNPDETEKTQGSPDLFWGTLNFYQDAIIYYLDRQYLNADLSAHRGFTNFLKLPKDKILERNIILQEMLNYYHFTAADNRMSRVLADQITDDLLKNPDNYNEFSRLNLLYYIINISPEYLNKLNINLEDIFLVAKNIDEKFNTFYKSLFNDLIAIHSISLSLKGESSKAKEFYNSFKYNDPNIETNNILNKFADLYILKNEVVIDEKVKEMFEFNLRRYKQLQKQNSDKKFENYDYLYSSLFEAILKSLQLKNNKLTFDKEAEIIVDRLYRIANVFKHSPGTTIPSISYRNRLLLEVVFNILDESNLTQSTKQKAFFAISSISLDSDEQTYIQNHDLIDSIDNDYLKEVAIDLTNFVSKRSIEYARLSKLKISNNEVDPKEINSLIKFNEVLEDTQKKVSQQSQKKLDYKIDYESLLVNLFCLEINCYSLLKTSSNVILNSINKNSLQELNSQLLSSIEKKSDFDNLSYELGNLIFDGINFNNIKNCDVVATSGLTNLPINILKYKELGDKFLIDQCSIRYFASIQHFQRYKNKSDDKKYSKWALAFADPEIIDLDENKSIDETLKLIRGGSIESLPELPETLIEAKAIAGDDKTSKLITRKDLTKENVFKNNLSEYQIVSFSSHGLMAGETNQNPEPSILLSGHGPDRLLTSKDILDLDGASKIVFLGVCNASKETNNLNPNEIINIANAFIIKGSDSIISTRWSLASSPSVEIISNALNFYRNDKLNLSASINKSVRMYREDNPDSHPKDWAAFITIGDSNFDNYKREPITEGAGLISDLKIYDENIHSINFTENGVSLDIYDLELKNKKTLMIDSNDSLDPNEGIILDAKFVKSQSKLFLLGLTNTKLNLYNSSSDGAIQKSCSIDIEKGFFNRFGAIALDGTNKLYYALLTRNLSQARIGLLDLQSCKEYPYYIQFGNDKIENQPHDRIAFFKQKGEVFVMANTFLTKENRLYYEEHNSYSGEPYLCTYKNQVAWMQLVFKDKKLEAVVADENFRLANGYRLPKYSNKFINTIIAEDYCSSKLGLLKFDNLKELIPKADDYTNRIDYVNQPGFISTLKESEDVIIHAESNFISEDFYIDDDIEKSAIKKSLTKKDLDSYMNVVLNRNDKKTIIGRSQSCNLFSSDINKNYVITACSSFNRGFSIQKKVIND